MIQLNFRRLYISMIFDLLTLSSDSFLICLLGKFKNKVLKAKHKRKMSLFFLHYISDLYAALHPELLHACAMCMMPAGRDLAYRGIQKSRAGSLMARAQ